MDVTQHVLNSPVTSYLLGFGGLGAMLVLALNTLHKLLKFSDRVWGIALLAAGAFGGIMLQQTGLVTLPVSGDSGPVALAAFVGAGVACAAAGFSNLDLRSMIKGKIKDD
jgi:hypothetical protein